MATLTLYCFDDGYTYGGAGGGFVPDDDFFAASELFEVESWMRFTGASGLAGMTIDSAELSVVNMLSLGTNSTIFHAERSASPTTPTGRANYLARSRTSASVVWDIPNTDPGAPRTSPDLKDIIQELADDFNPTAIQLFWKWNAVGADASAYSTEFLDDYSATLTIEYSPSGPQADSEVTLPALAVAGDGGQSLSGNVDAGLAALIAEGSSKQSQSGSGAATFGALSAAGSATQAQEATGATTFGALIADAVGTIPVTTLSFLLKQGETVIASWLEEDIDNLTLTITQEQLASITYPADNLELWVAGGASQIWDLRVVIPAAVAPSGAGAAVLPSLITEGQASVIAPVDADGEAILPSLVAMAFGEAEQPIGTGDAQLAALIAEAEAIVRQEAVGAGRLPALVASGAGGPPVSGAGGALLGGLVAVGLGRAMVVVGIVRPKAGYSRFRPRPSTGSALSQPRPQAGYARRQPRPR